MGYIYSYGMFDDANSVMEFWASRLNSSFMHFGVDVSPTRENCIRFEMTDFMLTMYPKGPSGKPRPFDELEVQRCLFSAFVNLRVLCDMTIKLGYRCEIFTCYHTLQSYMVDSQNFDESLTDIARQIVTKTCE